MAFGHANVKYLTPMLQQISHFLTVFKRSVNRPQPFVVAVFALKPAALAGNSKAHQQLHNEASAPGHKQNVSHGQLQALSIVPADSPSLFVAVCSMFSFLSSSASFFSSLRQRLKLKKKKNISKEENW
ncbi:hypothetical protein HN873_057516 [Arachis hypogaea]|uniref:Uncharacterized protein n=1 Tax=Arachis hypogaea TaxID=3818 RepID=A0A444YW96_ARAHY|nr:hypothetical protein Ahy_B06g085967 [Arachis hypogaea]